MFGRTRVATALALAASAIAPAAATAASITEARTPAEAKALAQAISNDPSTVVSSTFPTIAPVQLDGAAPAALSDVPLATFPRNGSSYAILSTGDARFADDTPQPGIKSEDLEFFPVPGRGPTAQDAIVWSTLLNVPANTNCLILRFRFLSEEFPDFVNLGYNDAFVAEIGPASTWTSTANNDPVNAPLNFAFDQANQPVSINGTGTGASAVAASDTTYGGATRRLAAAKVVTPGVQSTLHLSILDQGDGIYDSAVFVDGLEFRNIDPAKCTSGAFQDDVPPNLTAGAPSSTPEALVQNNAFTQDDTPTFGGRGGTGLNDNPTVSGSIFPGSATRGTPVQGAAVQTKTATITPDGSWTITAGTLPEGSYKFQASQGANNGETAFNDPIAFVVDKTGPKLSVLTTLFSGKTRDSTPLLGGVAGNAAGDGPALNVRLFAGPAATGNPVAGGVVTRAAGAWSLQVVQKLKDGVYTALADQADAAGNAGASGPLTFRVTTTNPIGKVKLPKHFKRANVARKLAGSLKFAFPGKVTYKATAKIGRRTYTIGSVKRTLKVPGVAKFSLKPNRGVASRIRNGRGIITLQTTFVDDQSRTYKRTQKVSFKR